MRDPLEVLVVEDDAVTRQILVRILTDRDYRVSAFGSAEEAMRACEGKIYPLLFLDLALPGADGFAFCRWLRALPGGDRSLVLVGTASEHPDDLRKILEAGADDYIRKPYRRDLLDIRLTIAEERIKQLEAKRLLEESLNQERERLRYLAVHDPLTRIRNRATLAETMDRIVDEARNGEPGALIYIDLDNFKSVNDSFGHAAGDELLITVASVLTRTVRSGDILFRLGGDEFCILMQALQLSEVKLVAERIRVNIAIALRSANGNPCAVAASIGIASIDGKLLGDRVMRLADAAVYRAKAAGGDRVQV
ncbi:MAG: diguanylate cyclase [Verrucomicrobia bacterium]|nr:diguanylate cyclase [Verrucomicrobiota bacterium]